MQNSLGDTGAVCHSTAATAQEDSPLKKPSRKKPLDEEARLDQALEKFLGKRRSDYPPGSWARMRETMRIEVLYPGKYVAFRDHYEGEGDKRYLKKREVVCVSRTLPGLHKRLAKLPEEAQWVCVSWVDRHDALGYINC
jgi:hypothetical protein